MKSIQMKPIDIIIEARSILDERTKRFFSFLFLNFGCLGMNALDKPHLWFSFLVVGCYLLYDLKRK